MRSIILKFLLSVLCILSFQVNATGIKDCLIKNLSKLTLEEDKIIETIVVHPRNASTLKTYPDFNPTGDSFDQYITWLKNNSFKTSRNLHNYVDNFGSPFLNEIKKLKNGDHWVDAGAGQAKALKNYLLEFDSAEKASVTAISLSKPKEYKHIGHPKFKYVVSSFEKLGPNAPKNVSLITDFYGPIAYSKNLPLILKSYFKMLKKDGKVIVRLASLYDIKIYTKDKKILNFLDWLGEIPGIEAKSYSKKFRNMNRHIEGETVVITKTAAIVEVPPLKLKAMIYDDMPPPKWIYQQVK